MGDPLTRGARLTHGAQRGLVRDVGQQVAP